MSESEATRHANNVLPPREGKIIALTLDATARAYDLKVLELGGASYKTDLKGQRVYLTMQAETADCFFLFCSDGTTSLNQATAIAAGSALAYNDAYCARLPANTAIDVHIDKDTDRYLVVKGSAAGVLRFWASSQVSASAM